MTGHRAMRFRFLFACGRIPVSFRDCVKKKALENFFSFQIYRGTARARVNVDIPDHIEPPFSYQSGKPFFITSQNYVVISKSGPPLGKGQIAKPL